MAAGDGTVLTLAAARDQLRVGDEVDDLTLAPLIAAAEAAIVDELGRDLVGPDSWATAAEVPANVVHATKIALTSFYDDRTAALPRAAILSLIGRWVRVSFG